MFPSGRKRTLRLACEFSASRITAAKTTDGNTIEFSSVRTLGGGALAPNLTATNIVHRDIVKTAVQEAMAGGAGSTRDVIMVLPDAACRITLLDFDSLPEKREEAESIVRFRLKKSLPFDVEKARVSYHVQGRVNGTTGVVAVVVLNTVLEEYESLMREAGYIPGVVLPSMLAALGQVDASLPTLVVKVDPVTTSVAIVDQERLLLIRTLENPVASRPDPAQLAEDAYSSLVFYQDSYGTKVEQILVGGVASSRELQAALEEHTGIRAQELVSSSRLDVGSGTERSSLCGVLGALASS